MIFGDTSTFAIEIDSIFKHSATPFGKILLWIDGEKVGDGVEGSDIPFALESFIDPLLFSSASLRAGMPFEEGSKIVDDLVRIRFADNAANFDEREHLLTRLRRYIIPSAYDIEGFERFFIVVLRSNNGECRIIWREKESAETKECTVPETAYRQALVACYDWISKQMGLTLASFGWLEMSEQEKGDIRARVCKRDPKLAEAANEDKLLSAEIAEAFSRSGGKQGD
jgi:hypothetical protein